MAHNLFCLEANCHTWLTFFRLMSFFSTHLLKQPSFEQIFHDYYYLPFSVNLYCAATSPPKDTQAIRPPRASLSVDGHFHCVRGRTQFRKGGMFRECQNRAGIVPAKLPKQVKVPKQERYTCNNHLSLKMVWIESDGHVGLFVVKITSISLNRALNFMDRMYELRIGELHRRRSLLSGNV